MTTSGQDWHAPLREVQNRERRRMWLVALRRALVVLAGVTLAAGLLRWGLALPVQPWVAAACGVVAALLWLAWERGRARPFGELDAARLADRRAELDGVLSTALTLHPAESPSLEAALHTRVLAQAGEAARHLNAKGIVRPDPARVWALPALLLGAGLGAWLLPARPVTASAPVAAVIADEPKATESQSSSGSAALEAAAPPSSTPETPQTSSLNDIPKGQEPDAPDSAPSAPPSDAVSGTALATADLSSSAGAFTPKRLREARQAILPSDTRHMQERLAKAGGTSVDTPFGSREGGRISRQEAGPNPDALAAAPYDPTTAKGQAQQQKAAPPGSTGLRSASGGRGVESNGDERCVDQCMTNNDMNRGGNSARDAGKKLGSGVSSGTSNSGSQAAGSSSGTGLGVGQLKDLQASYRETLLGQNNVNADRVQVLVAPTSVPPTQVSPAGGVGGASWRTAPETPGLHSRVPESARATVSAYFARTSDRSNP